MATYQVSRDEQELGSFEEEELQLALENGTLEATDLVWDEEAQAWLPLHEAFEIEVETSEAASEEEALTETVKQAAAEVDDWDSGFTDSPVPMHEEAAEVHEPVVFRPQRSGCAAGWASLGIMALVAMALLALGYPVYLKVTDATQLAPAQSTARAILRAVTEYASTHAGALPNSLDELSAIPGMNDKPPGSSGEAGYHYYGAGQRSDSGSKDPLIESKWLSSQKNAVVGYLNGDVKVLRVSANQ